MSRSIRSIRNPLFASALMGAALFAAQPSAFADEKPEPATISVSAQGSANIAPDMAVINLTVLREADTAREALDANTAAMSEVLAAMKDAGIEDRDLQTSNFSVQPKWFYPQPKNDGTSEEPRIVGYQVSNGLSVRIRDLSKVGELLDKSVSLGVNQGGQIIFTNDDPTEALSQARKQAVENAMKKASEMVEAAGAKLGRITAMSEQSNIGRPVPMMRAEMAMAAKDAAPVPVAAGENEYNVNVSISWEIDQ